MKPFWRPIFVLTLLTIIGITLFEVRGSKNRTSLERMCGVNWVGGDSITISDLDPLRRSHVNWIIQTPFGWMNEYNDPQVIMADQNAYYWGESDRGIEHTANLTKELGIRTILKPHIWMNPRKGKWRSDIRMESDSAWGQWFKSYEQFILHYARLAERNGLEGLCIGTELYFPSTEQEERFRDLIRKIRKEYSGKLVYAANWYQEFEEIQFWDDLDMIGIQAYFPLVKNENPTPEELEESWGAHKDKIRAVAEKFQKPVIFTEVGYRSMADAAIEPWLWPERNVSMNKISYETQALCYEALFNSFWNEPWFEGTFFWKWYPKHDDLRQTARNNGFTPQKKPAEEVMKNGIRDPPPFQASIWLIEEQ